MHRWYRIVALLVLTALPLPAGAQNYPSRPIKAIASQGPGGLSDLFMRALGDQMGPALGTSIVVEDRTGAEGTIGAKACADAAPDGYTICILPGETIVINPVIYPSDFDPSKALVPVARPYYLTQVFAVNASLGVKTFPELAALVKSKPKTFNYMAPSLSKVAFMEQFNKKNGTDIVRVPFKGGGDAVTSMLNGTTQIAIFGIGNLISFIRDEKWSALPSTATRARRWRPTSQRSRRSAIPSISPRPFSAFLPRPARRSRSSINSTRRSSRSNPSRIFSRNS